MMSEKKQEPKAKPPKMVTIKVIETRGESSLVEWIDADKIRCRCYIENDLIHDSKVLQNTLANPLPVGPDPRATDLHKLTEQLRKRNVWTLADFQQKPKAVILSLLEAMEAK